jgi:hypothetical protein
MALEDRIWALRKAALDAGEKPVPTKYQCVSKKRIAEVLEEVDRRTDDIVDAVFALLDNQLDSWFGKIAKQKKFCDGATTAHIACHVGILQRGFRKLDREGRDYWIKPLRDIGAIEPIYLQDRDFIHGHPVPKSSNSAYRLSDEFKKILQASEATWRKTLKTWIQKDRVLQRLDLQAKLADESRQHVDTKHSDLIEAACKYYLPKFFPEFEVLYIDDRDGDRIAEEAKTRMEKAGIEIKLDDAMPDVLAYNREADVLWVVEAVTSDGEVDLHKVKQMRDFAKRYGKKNIGFTTVYGSWKEAASRQGRFKNLAPDTYLWIQEDPSKHFLAETFPEEANKQ